MIVSHPWRDSWDDGVYLYSWLMFMVYKSVAKYTLPMDLIWNNLPTIFPLDYLLGCFWLSGMSVNKIPSISWNNMVGIHSGINQHGNGKWTRIEPMYVLLKMVIFQPAMLVYQRVLFSMWTIHPGVAFAKTPVATGIVWFLLPSWHKRNANTNTHHLNSWQIWIDDCAKKKRTAGGDPNCV